jgi:RNA:NAD 2'-phosphotransferase (TPT1/KptA family)
MALDSDARAYLAELGKRIRPLATELHDALLSLGCISYVKTIYIGYDIDGEMVAALYGHSDHVEIALALPEDAEGDLLVDASHLTWRTLPVAAIVRSSEELSSFTNLASDAVERVRTASHSVHRDNDYFIKSRRERRGR